MKFLILAAIVNQYGQTIGFIEDDGEIHDQYGQTIGFIVEEDKEFIYQNEYGQTIFEWESEDED